MEKALARTRSSVFCNSVLESFANQMRKNAAKRHVNIIKFHYEPIRTRFNETNNRLVSVVHRDMRKSTQICDESNRNGLRTDETGYTV